MSDEQKAPYRAKAKEAFEQQQAARVVALGQDADKPLDAGVVMDVSADVPSISLTWNSIDMACLSKLGQGTYGSVYKFSDGCYTHVAGKVASDRRQEEISAEYDLIRRCSHPAVIQSFGLINACDEACSPVLLMPLGQGTLSKKCEAPPSLMEAMTLLRQLCGGLRYLGHRNILHCDIKPSNIILYESGTCARLADFGLAMIMKEGRAICSAGRAVYSGAYKPVEVLLSMEREA